MTPRRHTTNTIAWLGAEAVVMAAVALGWKLHRSRVATLQRMQMSRDELHRFCFALEEFVSIER